MNFTPVEYPDYRVGVVSTQKHTLILDSDEPEYTGETQEKKRKKKSYTPEKQACDGQAYSIGYPLPSFGVALFSFDYDV